MKTQLQYEFFILYGSSEFALIETYVYVVMFLYLCLFMKIIFALL